MTGCASWPMGKCLQHDHTLEGYSTTDIPPDYPRTTSPLLSKYWNKVKKYHHSLWPKTSYDGMDKNLNESELENYKGYKRPEEITHLIYTRVISTHTHSLHRKKKNCTGIKEEISCFLKIETSTKSLSKQTKSNSNRKTCQKALDNAAASPNRWTVLSGCPLYMIRSNSNPKQSVLHSNNSHLFSYKSNV